MYKRTVIILATFTILSQMNAQIFNQADPFYLLEKEKQSFSIDKNKNFLIRPFLNYSDTSLSGTWSVGFRSELYFNDNAPNL